MIALRRSTDRACTARPAGRRRLALSGILVLATALAGDGLLVGLAHPAQQAPQVLDFSTLRLHGYPALGHPDDAPYANRPAGPGSNSQDDPLTGLVPEEAPYTAGEGPFDPQSAEAPEMDWATWNPAWISERLAEPSLRANWPALRGVDEVSAAANIRAGGINASQKVWLRHWYEPMHLDLDLNADGRLTSDEEDEDYGAPLAPVNPTPSAIDEWYPAIMTEYSYMLVENDPLPLSRPRPAELGRSAPRPTCGRVGGTRIVFPVGISTSAADPAGAAQGQGLTSLDADFDGRLDMINVNDEAGLPAVLGGLRLDFDGDGVLDALNPDGQPLSCDEMAVLHTDAMTLRPGGRVQFLDHYVQVQSVTGNAALLDVYYTGDLVPRLIQRRSVAIGAAALAGDTGPLLVLGGVGGTNLGTVPPGAWFVYVQDVDGDQDTAIVTVGRALGAPCASMQAAAGQSNLVPGGPYFLKRFYVDGHAYNVAAIYACNPSSFQYLTLRAPLPKVPVILETHSVRLQEHALRQALPLLPPFNHEHTVLDDVDEAPAFTDLTPDQDEPRPLVLYMGSPVGPVPPVLGPGEDLPYRGRIAAAPVGPYTDPRASRWLYNQEDTDPAFIGQLREKLGARAPQTAPQPGLPDRFFYNEQVFTLPWHYTEFVLPDLDEGAGAGAYNADDVLVTTAFTNPTARWRRWRMPAGAVPPEVPPSPPDLAMDVTPDNGFSLGAPHRAGFWFDPDIDDKLFYDASGLRIYGGQPGPTGEDCDPRRPSIRFGAGDLDARDPISGSLPVEVPPYTDPFAPFNPQHPHAPRADSLTLNPAYLDEFRNFGEPLRGLYSQISSAGQNAREKVYHRLWYQPDYITKVRQADACERDLSFLALMQEFTYTYVDMTDQPTAAPVGTSRFAFPIGSLATELPAPLSGGSLPAGGAFGYGLTTFDANFDAMGDAVTVHSERSLATYLDAQWQAHRPVPPGPPPPVVPGPRLDFDGDGLLDGLNPDGQRMNGDEMVVFAVESLELDLDPNTPQAASAMVLDHLVSLDNVTRGGRAQLRFWFTGGSATAARPEAVGGPQSLAIGDAAIVDRFQDAVTLVGPGATNSGPRGAWFAFLEAVDADEDRISITLGRALGATHSAIDDGAGAHDLLAGDPWYLKRFYVDGHEYNVVALDTEAAAGNVPDRFAFITLRSPTPKGNYFNPQDTLLQQGYFLNGLPPRMPVPPPFNGAHTVVKDVERQPRTAFADPSGLGSCVGPLAAAGARELTILAEEPEPRFASQLREIWDRDGAGLRWETDQLRTTPSDFTELRLPRDQLALLTLNWTSPVSRLGFYGCSPARPGPFPDGEVGISHGQLTAAAAGWAPPTGIVPAPNRDRTVEVGNDEVTLPYYDARIGTDRVRVKFFYDPAASDDPYVNPRAIPVPQPRDPRLAVRKVLTTADPAMRGDTVGFTLTVLNTGNVALTDVDLRDVFATAYLDYVSASLAPATVDEAGGILTWNNIEAAAPGGGFDPGEQIVITVNFRATAETPDGVRATNTVRATALGAAVVADPAADDVAIRTPRLEIAKRLLTRDPTTVGSTVSYALVLQNSGTAVLSDVDVSDSFDTAYLDFLSANPAQSTADEAAGLLTWNNVEGAAPGGTFDPGEQILITVNFRAVAPSPDPTKARNTASASALGGTVLTGRVSQDVEINPAPVPSLQVLKQLRGPNPTTIGATVEFIITVANNGNAPVADVDLTDSFDTAYLDYLSASFTPASIDEAAGQVRWENIEVLAPGGSLDPGEQAVIIVRFRAAAATPDPTRAVNRALVTAPGLTVAPSQAEVEINAAPQPRIAVAKRLTSPDPTTVGATVSFDVVVSNTGNTVLTDVDLADSYMTVPLDFQSASLAPTANNDAAGTIAWDNLEAAAPGGTFDPGESILLSVRFLATAGTADPAKAVNRANVAALAGTLLDGPAAAQVEINRPAVSIRKRLTSVNPTAVGMDVGFQIVIRNEGDIRLVDVNVDDAFEAAFLQPMSALPPAAQTDPVAGTLRWLDIESAAPGGTFDPGDEIVINTVFRARAATPAGDPATNRVRVATNGGAVTAGPVAADVTINSTLLVAALSCRAEGPDSIALTWRDESSQETAFQIQAAVGGSAFMDLETQASGSGPGQGGEQSLRLAGLLPGLEHRFRIRALDAGSGARSPWLEAEAGCATTAVAPETVGCVSGRVVAEGRASSAGLAIKADGAPAGSTAADGSFQVCQIPTGLRRITAEGACFLRVEAADTEVAGGRTADLGEVALVGGDVNGSQGVDLFDLVRVGADFRASPPTDEAADCTGDGTVNIFDLVMVGANYDLAGPVAWGAPAVSGRPATLSRALALGQDDGPVALRQRQEAEGLAADIVLRGAQPMYGADIELSFDPEQVAIVDALPDWPETQVLPGTAWGQSAYLARNRVDMAGGRIRLAASLKAPAEPLSGEQVLATVRFRPLVERPNALALALTAVSLSDQRGRPIALSFAGREVQSRPGGGRLEHWLSLPWLNLGR